MSTRIEAVKQYYRRDKIRFWLFLASLILLLGQFICAILILVEEAVLVDAISRQKYTDDDLTKCRMYTTTQNGTLSFDNFQRRVLFWAQLVSHTVADCQLLFTLSLAVRSIHLERAFRAHVLLVFPFSWTWTCCISLLSWPFLPMMAMQSVKTLEKCTVARFLFIVGIWHLVGALVIYALAFGGWRRHEKKVLNLVARRQNQLSNSTDSILSDLRYRPPIHNNNGSVDDLLNSTPSPALAYETDPHPYYVSCPYSPQLAESTLAVNAIENGRRSIYDSGEKSTKNSDDSERRSVTAEATEHEECKF